jgi:RNA polymerase sigma-70 factor (ECF subfamily)
VSISDEKAASRADVVALSIVQARDGSSSALGMLLEPYRDYLLHLARAELDRTLIPKVGHSDLVQETFYQAAKDFPKFQGTSDEQLRAWLRQILHHNVSDVARRYERAQKRTVWREQSLDDARAALSAGQVPCGDLTPSRHTEAAEQSAVLLIEICRLNDIDRRAIELRSLQGKSFEEVGMALERSTEAARKIWVRAVEKLAGRLADV